MFQALFGYGGGGVFPPGGGGVFPTAGGGMFPTAAGGGMFPGASGGVPAASGTGGAPAGGLQQVGGPAGEPRGGRGDMHPAGGVFGPREEIQGQICGEQRSRADHPSVGAVDQLRHSVSAGSSEHRQMAGGNSEHRQMAGGNSEHRQMAGGNTEHRQMAGGTSEHRQMAALELGSQGAQPTADVTPAGPHQSGVETTAPERDSAAPQQEQARVAGPTAPAGAAGLKREVPVDDLLRAYLGEEAPDDTTKVGALVQVVTKDPFIERMLSTLQLEHLMDAFANNNIDRETVSFMSPEELKEVCPSVGHRIKIRNYLAKFDRPSSPLGCVSPERTGGLSNTLMAMGLSHEVFTSEPPPCKRPRRSPGFRFFKDNKSLLELLSSSEMGRLLLQAYDSKKNFDHRERAKLTHLVVDGLLDSPLVFKIPMLEEVADEVVRLFPSEVKQSYYIAPSPDRRAGAGKLVDRFKNQRRFFLKYRGRPRRGVGAKGKKGRASEGEDQPSDAAPTSSSEDQPPTGSPPISSSSPAAPTRGGEGTSYAGGDGFIQRMLGQLGLDCLLDTFSCQNIDREVLSLMSEDDLKVLVPTYEHRTKIVEYLARADAASPRPASPTSPAEGDSASDKPIGYRSTDRSFFNFSHTLGEYLRGTSVGRVLMESYSRRGTFDNGERCKLTRVIVDGVYERHVAMRSELFAALAGEVVKEFPSEDRAHYYTPPTPLRKMCGGKLVQRYRNVKRLLRRYAGEDVDTPAPRRAVLPKRPPKAPLPPRVSSTRGTRCRYSLDEGGDDWPPLGRGSSSPPPGRPPAPPPGGRDDFIERMLTDLGLEYLLTEFRRQSIDREVISTMSPEDLREVCPIIGHRTKIRNYLARCGPPAPPAAPAPHAADSTSSPARQAPEDAPPSPAEVDDALASFGSRSTVRTFFRDDQTLWEFLTSRGLGRALLQTYAAKGEFSVQERQKLVHLLVEGLLERHTTVRASLLGELAGEVVQQFPTEVKSIYFVPSARGRKVSSGKLVDRYRNVRKLLYALARRGRPRARRTSPSRGDDASPAPAAAPTLQTTGDVPPQQTQPHTMGPHELPHMMVASTTGPMGQGRPHHLLPDGDMGPAVGGHRGYDSMGGQVSSTSWDQGAYWGGGGRGPLAYGGQGGGPVGSSLQLFPGGRTLGQHLAASELGRSLVAAYARRGHFEPSERRKLVQVVVEGLLGQQEHRVSTSTLQQVAYEVVAEFPSEDRLTYYVGPLESGRRNASGKLVIRYRNRKKHHQRTAPPEQTYYLTPEVQLKVHQLQTAGAPWQEVEVLWRETHAARAHDRRLGLPTSVFLAKWAPLKGERGPLLVQWDFDVDHPGKRARLRPQWTSCSARLLRALQQRPNCGGLPTPADTSRTAELLSALSYLLQPSMIKNARGHWRPSMVEASEAFLFRTEDVAEVGRHQARLGAKCAHHGVPHQPQMFELGGGGAPQYLVPIEEATWRFSDPLTCLDALFCAYHVLGLAYQPACRNTWVLVQRLLYDMASADDRLAPCVSVLVNELGGGGADRGGGGGADQVGGGPAGGRH